MITMKKHLFLTALFNTTVGLFSHTFATQGDNFDDLHAPLSNHKKEVVLSDSKLVAINNLKDMWMKDLNPEGMSK